MKHSWLAALAIVAALSGFIALAAARQWDAFETVSVREAKLLHADRVVYYRVTHSDGPRFRLAGRERQLNVVSHLRLAPSVTYDPAHDYEYGIAVVIRSPLGEPLWEREIFTSSRQSKHGWQDGSWTHENTFGVDGMAQYTDDRVLRITLPETFAPDSQLELRLVGQDDATGLVRIYERRERSSIDSRVAALALSPREQARWLARLTYLPWSELSDPQREARIRYRWDRLAAIGEPQQDYFTETVYVSDFRQHRETIDRTGTLVTPQFPVALNVQGPVRLRFDIGGAAEPGELVVEDLRADGGASTTAWALAPAEQLHHEAVLEPGVHSLLVRTTISAGVWVSVRPDDAAALPLEPQTHRSLRYRLDRPSPAVVSVGETAEVADRIVRVEVRALGPIDPSGAEVRVRFADAAGRELAAGAFTHYHPLADASFETVWADEGERAPVSEPTVVRVIAPPASRAVLLSSDAPLVASAYAFLPHDGLQAAEQGPPSDAELAGVRWRYAVQDDPVWFSVRTDNHFELARQGAVLWLQTQTRLERLIEAPLVGESLDFAAIRPRDAEQHQLMFEEIRDAERIAAWAAEGRRLWTRLQPNRAERIHHVGADGPLILYRARADAMQVLGRTARILVDRSLASERRLLTDNGQWRLEAIDPGLHEVEVEVDADLAMYVDRARRGASTAFVRRTVVPLGRKKLSIAVRKTTEQSVTLNAIVYDTRPQGDLAPIVEAWVDGGKPRRNTAVPVERITIAQDRWQLSEPLRTSNVEFLSRDLSGPVRVYAVRVHLGADIVAGEHTITVRSNVPHGLWVRFFAATEESSWSDDPGGTQWPLSGGADD